MPSDGWFLALYAGIVVLGAGLCLLTRAVVLRAPGRLRRLSAAERGVHPVDLACLVSGPEHAAVVAFLGLWQRGAVRPRGGSLAARPGDMPVTRAVLAELTVAWEMVDGEPLDDPLEEAVAKAVRQAGEPSTQSPEVRQEEAIAELLGGLRRRLHPRLDIQERLHTHGLIVDTATERQVLLAALWPLLVLGIGIAWLIAHAGNNPVALLPLLAAAAGILLAALRAPRVTPLGRRVVAEAGKPTRAVAEQMAQQIKSDLPYGTDDPEVERIGTDPVAAAAHGPPLVWGAAPVLPASFGFLPPRPDRLRHSGGTVQPESGWWVFGTTGGSLAGWGTLAGWGGDGGHGGDHGGDGGDGGGGND